MLIKEKIIIEVNFRQKDDFIQLLCLTLQEFTLQHSKAICKSIYRTITLPNDTYSSILIAVDSVTLGTKLLQQIGIHFQPEKKYYEYFHNNIAQINTPILDNTLAHVGN